MNYSSVVFTGLVTLIVISWFVTGKYYLAEQLVAYGAPQQHSETNSEDKLA